MKVSCDCDDWADGMEQIVGAQLLASNHGIKYTAQMFRFCPWCGKELSNATSTQV